MDSKLVVYGDEVSPPVRFVLMTASMLDVKVDYHHIELFKAENKSLLYKKINPLQKVPALQVGEEVICDSHAIALYLCQVGNGRLLYPEDAITRARINQMLFYNSGTLFPIDSFILSDYFRGKWPADETKINEWYTAVDHLEHQLTSNTLLASEKVSLADLCCAATVSSLRQLVPLLDRHVKVTKWLDRLQKLSCFEINSRGLEKLKTYVNDIKLLQ